jgi:lipopolysaccharide transport system ATP-binding protein
MPIIEVNHVTKEYQLGQLQSLKTTALNQWRRLTGQPVEERVPFKALDDINFSIELGEVVGIIGQNGAGKSTILKLLANISKPSSGCVTVKGKVAPLIEVGAGLVGDLTGRENIYLNGAILGIAKAEIKRKFDDIVAFAELEEFIDTPIKRYSSGMQVRLGFSIATSVESDILIVDEVLAVGDLAFQRKCFDRMESLIKQQGKTVLLVSHNIRQVELISTRAILLGNGKVIADGLPKDVCNLFYSQSGQKVSLQSSKGVSKTSHFDDSDNGELELSRVVLKDGYGKIMQNATYDLPLIMELHFRVHMQLSNPQFAIGLHTTDFLYLMGDYSERDICLESLPPGNYKVTCRLPRLQLMPGIYSLHLGVGVGQTQRAAYYADSVLQLEVLPNPDHRKWSRKSGLFGLEAQWEIVEANLHSVQDSRF